MSLERQDVRSKLDPDKKRDLQAICDAKGITEAEFIENLLVPEIDRLIREAHAIASRTARAGITGKNREQPGELEIERDLPRRAGERR